MALNKRIELNNGIVLNYHRIASINKITNHAIILEVDSYTSKEKRFEEIQLLQSGEPMDIYVHGDLINISYDENLTIKDLYEYLKTTDKYLDADDI